tara:strand:+ start:936 stop:1709 length:774 start_codon:yes stop_codon:yes gene_type:complete
MFEKTKRLTTEDLEHMASSVKYDWSIDNVEDVIVDKSKDEEDMNEFLTAKHPFRAVIIGRSGSGKTILTMNLLLKYLKYDCIYVICSTVHLQPKYDLIVDCANLFPNKFKLFTTMSAFKLSKVNKKNKNLVLLDDIQELDEKNMRKVNELFVRGRHHNVSVIWLGQNYFKCPIRARGSANMFCFFKVNSSRELGRIHSEVCSDLSREAFDKLFREATEEQPDDPKSKFGCLVIDTEQTEDCMRYRRNFKQLYLCNLE